MSLSPRFDHAVPPGGYAWWYVDALSDDDGRYGLAIIGFVGSVFSPYYAWARARSAAADPLNHCAINVGLYLPGRHVWTMTERALGSTHRGPNELVVGPSAMHWDGGQLRIDIDEIAAPLPSRVRGTILLHPHAAFGRDFPLEPTGQHRWRPLAPRAHVEVDLQSPALQWRGTGYFDSNVGDSPLEAAFHHWQWNRAHLDNGITAISYDAAVRNGADTSMGLRIENDAVFVTTEPARHTPFGRTAWGISRSVAVDQGTSVRLLRTLENGPFYARSLLDMTVHGRPALAVHESLSLDRFASPLVRAMLPFKMPRVGRSAPTALRRTEPE